MSTLVCWGHTCVLSHFHHVWLFGDPMDCSPPGSSVHGISQQEYQSGLPCPPLLEDLPDPGIEPASLKFPAVSGGFFTTRASWEALWGHISTQLSRPPSVGAPSLSHWDTREVLNLISDSNANDRTKGFCCPLSGSMVNTSQQTRLFKRSTPSWAGVFKSLLGSFMIPQKMKVVGLGDLY